MKRSTHADVNKAVEAAKKAVSFLLYSISFCEILVLKAPEWSALSLLDRAAWLDKIADYLEKNSDHVAHLESQDTGKPMKVAVIVNQFYCFVLSVDSNTACCGCCS